jgi:plastocyanin
MKRGTIMITIAVIAILGIAAVYLLGRKASAPAASSSSTTDTSQTGSTSTGNDSSGAIATDAVTIQGFAFSPANITVKKGATVTWTNKDSANHSIISDTSNGPSSSLFGQGQTYSFTFNTAGTFNYHCGVHPDMTGKVTVTE